MTASKPPASRPANRRSKPPFEVLLDRHGPAVLRVCRALVGVQEADDVWQETFLAALRAYPEADVRNAEAWLVTIARNKAMDHHRKAARLPLPAGDGVDVAEVVEVAEGRGGGAGIGGAHTRATGAGHAGGSAGVGDIGTRGGDVVVLAAEAAEEAAAVWAALAALPPTQREAVAFHHLAGLAYADVAPLLGNSEAAARRAAADGMKALRSILAPWREGQHED